MITQRQQFFPTIKEIDDWFVNKEIYIDKMQRGYIWTKEKKSFYSDSINNNRSTSLICLGKVIRDGEEKWQILDGQQRIKTNNAMINNMFKMYYNGTKVFFSELPREEQERILNTKVSVEKIVGEENEYNVQYEGLNNGKPMTGSERTNSIVSDANNYLNSRLVNHSFFVDTSFYGFDDNKKINSKIYLMASRMLYNAYLYDTSDRFKKYDEANVKKYVHSVPLDEQICELVEKVLDEMCEIFSTSEVGKGHLKSMALEVIMDRFNFILSLVKQGKEFGEEVRETILSWSRDWEDRRKNINDGGVFADYFQGIRKDPISANCVKNRHRILHQEYEKYIENRKAIA